MRVLCTTHPGSGHLHPLVPLAQALEHAGHEVAVATAASFGSTVEAAGLRSLAAGFDWLQAESEVAMPGFMAADGPGQILMLARLARPMANDVLRLAAEFKPDLILRDAMEYGGWVAAERLGVPHAAYGIGTRLPGPIVRMWTGNVLSDLPRAYGLKADPSLSRLVRYLYLDPVPPRFELEGSDFIRALAKSFRAVERLTAHAFVRALGQMAIAPKTLNVGQRVRPPVFDRSGPEGVPPSVRALPRQPTVYATLGTVFNRQTHLLESIATAFHGEQMNLILTVGRNVDPARFGPQPSNVCIERYIPQSAVLPDCEAVISHGGYNTTISALCHGLPLCCLPLAADQPINTRRVVALGAGLSCANTTPYSSPFPIVDPDTLRPEEIRAAVRKLLTEHRFRDEAERMRREIDLLPAIEAAVPSLEQLAVTRAPVNFGGT